MEGFYYFTDNVHQDLGIGEHHSFEELSEIGDTAQLVQELKSSYEGFLIKV